jgi:formiminotetrahydrofolate cyclodeaminase
MAAPLDFSSQSLAEFCDTIAAETSAPGGGSVAAVVGAMAASLAAMAARFSTEQWEDAAGAVAQAEALKARLLPLADEDARAYENVLLALRMPKELDEEVRDAAIGDALSRATDVPMAIAEASLDVATLAAELAERGNPNLHGDAVAADEREPRRDQPRHARGRRAPRARPRARRARPADLPPRRRTAELVAAYGRVVTPHSVALAITTATMMHAMQMPIMSSSKLRLCRCAGGNSSCLPLNISLLSA